MWQRVAFFLVIGFWLLIVVIYLRAVFKALFIKHTPYLGSYGRHLRLMKEKLRLDAADSMVDLGSGDGKALRFFAKFYPIKQLDGYDIHWGATLLGRFLTHFSPYRDRIRLYRGDLREVDLGQYDYIYTFLLSYFMAELEDWVFDTMHDDAIVVANTFPFPNREPYEILVSDDGKSKVFLYRKDKKIKR